MDIERMIIAAQDYENGYRDGYEAAKDEIVHCCGCRHFDNLNSICRCEHFGGSLKIWDDEHFCSCGTRR